jgi:hypothetical protein
MGNGSFLKFWIFESDNNELIKVEGFMDGEFKKISNNFDHLDT